MTTGLQTRSCRDAVSTCQSEQLEASQPLGSPQAGVTGAGTAAESAGKVPASRVTRIAGTAEARRGCT
jgi:hypothetical protein